MWWFSLALSLLLGIACVIYVLSVLLMARFHESRIDLVRSTLTFLGLIFLLLSVWLAPPPVELAIAVPTLLGVGYSSFMTHKEWVYPYYDLVKEDDFVIWAQGLLHGGILTIVATAIHTAIRLL